MSLIEELHPELYERAEMLNKVLPKSLYAEVADVIDTYATLDIWKSRKLWFPKRIAEVLGDRIVLIDRSFYEQLKSVALRIGMKIVLI